MGAQRIVTTVTTSVVFDKHSNQIQMIDGKGKSVFAKYDPLDRNYLTTDRINADTNTRYDQNSNTLAITDGEEKTTAYEYELLRDLRIKTIHPDHVVGSNPGDIGYGIVEHEYDAARRTIRITDQAGDTKTMSWDMANRLLSEDYRTLANSPNGQITDSNTFEYDEASRQTKASSGRYNNVCEFTFDEAGRLETESLTVNWTSTPTTFTSVREYDTDNQLVKITYPDGSIVEREYTNRHQLEQVKWNGNVVHNRTYDDGGRIATTTHGNGVTSTFGHRSDNLLASINTPAAAGASHAVGNYVYDYDENKNKTQEAISGVMSAYGFGTGSSGATVYDDEDRLTDWNRADGNLAQAWDLSPVGNWNSITENSVVENRTHSPAHEIETIDAVPVVHDLKGNLTVAADGRSFSWDFENKLASVTVPAGFADGIEGTHNYTYDALGRRVSKHVSPSGGGGSASTRIYVCLGQQEILEYEVPTGGSPVVAAPDQKFVYASYVDEPILKEGKFSDGVTTGVVYYSRNQQYSITALTDAAGEVVERYAYSAYGQPVILNAAGSEISASQYSNHYTYTARRSDPESGLMYFRARVYDTKLGRFISRDPWGFVDGMSLYRAYFVPRGMDPFGLSEFQQHHWFPTALLKDIKKICSDFDHDEFTTHLPGGFDRGAAHHFIHHMSSYDLSDLKKGQRVGPVLDHSRDYNNAFARVINDSGGDCCTLITLALDLIQSYGTMIQFFRMETLGPQGFFKMELHRYNSDMGTHLSYLKYQEKVCGGKVPESSPIWSGDFFPKIDTGSTTVCIPGSADIELPYSPRERFESWNNDQPSWNSVSPKEAARRVERDISEIRIKEMQGLLPSTAGEIQSRYDQGAIDEVFKTRSTGEVELSQRMRQRGMRPTIQRRAKLTGGR